MTEEYLYKNHISFRKPYYNEELKRNEERLVIFHGAGWRKYYRVLESGTCYSAVPHFQGKPICGRNKRISETEYNRLSAECITFEGDE